MPYIKGEPFVQQFLDSNGDPLASGTLEFYVTGTSTPATVYTDSAGTSLGTSCTLNNLGQPQTGGGTAVDLYFDTTVTYKLVVKDSGGSQVGPTIDPFDVLPSNAISRTYSETVTTITALKSLTNQIANDTVIVLGHTSVGDGGGGVFRWDSSDTTTDDNGIYIQPNAGGTGRWIRDYSGPVHLLWFGLNNDGATNDSSTIQTILDSHDSVIADPGNFYLGSTIYVKKLGKTFVGSGIAVTTFTVAAGVEGIVVGNDATSNETNHNMLVGGFSITGGNYGLSLGGNGTGAKAMLGEVRDVRITSCTEAGLRLISPQGAAIHNVQCSSCGDGLKAEDMQAVTATTFVNCRFFNNTSHGANLKSGWGIKFIGTIFESNGGWGCYLEKNTNSLVNILFNGCWFESNTSGSITSDSINISDIAVVSCEFNGTSGTYHVDLASDNNTVLYNRFVSPSANAVRISNVNAIFYVAGNTGSISAIPTGRQGVYSSQEGNVSALSLNVAAGSGNTSLTLATGNQVITAGDFTMNDGTMTVVQSSNTNDGDIVSSFDISGGGTGVDVVRLNVGADADRVALKFTVAGVISSYIWVDDTGAPRFKTSLPTSDTDGTAM